MKPHARRRGGGSLLETALWIPILFLIMMGTVEFGRLMYTYAQLHKTLHGLARSLATQQGVNFCDSADATVTAAKQFALTGNIDGSGDPILRSLNAEQIDVRLERYLAETDSLIQCECAASATGCDTGQGAPAPNFIVVSLPEGYPVQLLLPGLPVDPIPLRPVIRVPYGGT